MSRVEWCEFFPLFFGKKLSNGGVFLSRGGGGGGEESKIARRVAAEQQKALEDFIKNAVQKKARESKRGKKARGDSISRMKYKQDIFSCRSRRKDEPPQVHLVSPEFSKQPYSHRRN